MDIALIGATGFVGSKVMDEALRRGHQVTAITRDASRIGPRPLLAAKSADVQKIDQAIAAVSGADLVISCFNAGHRPHPGQNVFKDTINGVANIIKATKASGVARLLFVGGASALYTADGRQLMDVYPAISGGDVSGTQWPSELMKRMPPEFALWDALLTGEVKHEHVEPLVHALMFFINDNSFDWSFFSPPPGLHPGPGTGQYRIGGSQVPEENGIYGALPIDDAALAIVDEAENNHLNRQHWTAYT